MFTIILIERIMNYIYDLGIFMNRINYSQFIQKIIFRSLLITFAAECTWNIDRCFPRLYGFNIGRPLPVNFRDMFMRKIENNVVIQSKPLIYCQLEDWIYSRRKRGDHILYEELDNYHLKVILLQCYLEVSFSKPKHLKVIFSSSSMLTENNTKLPIL